MSQIDSSSERIINYLSESYGVSINAVTFNYFRGEDGKELLVRGFLIEPNQVEENTQRQNNSKRQPNLSYTELEEIAQSIFIAGLHQITQNGNNTST